MSLILKHEKEKFNTTFVGDGFVSSLASLIPKVASFVTNNKALISSGTQAIGSLAKAGVKIHDTMKQSDELKELEEIRKMRNNRIEQQALNKKGGGFKLLG